MGDFITSDKHWNIELLKGTLNDHPIIHRIVGIPLPISDVFYSIS